MQAVRRGGPDGPRGLRAAAPASSGPPAGSSRSWAVRASPRTRSATRSGNGRRPGRGAYARRGRARLWGLPTRRSRTPGLSTARRSRGDPRRLPWRPGGFGYTADLRLRVRRLHRGPARRARGPGRARRRRRVVPVRARAPRVRGASGTSSPDSRLRRTSTSSSRAWTITTRPPRAPRCTTSSATCSSRPATGSTGARLSVPTPREASARRWSWPAPRFSTSSRRESPRVTIAVVFRRPRDYASLVDQVFGAYGIPFRSSAGCRSGTRRSGAGCLRC